MDRDLTYLRKGDMVQIPMQEPPLVALVLHTPEPTSTFVKVLRDGSVDWWHRTDCEIVNHVQEG